MTEDEEAKFQLIHRSHNEYRENGQLKGLYYILTNGEYDGPFEEYNSEGKLAHTGTYKNGFLRESITYYNNEQIRLHEHYNDEDELDGDWKFYDYNGNLDYHYLYRKGDVVIDYLEK